MIHILIDSHVPHILSFACLTIPRYWRYWRRSIPLTCAVPSAPILVYHYQHHPVQLEGIPQLPALLSMNVSRTRCDRVAQG
jgi:hypothetical protein